MIKSESIYTDVSQRLCRIGGALLCDIYTEDINKTGTYMEEKMKGEMKMNTNASSWVKDRKGLKKLK